MDMIQNNHKIVMRLHKAIELNQAEYERYKKLGVQAACDSIAIRLTSLRYIRDGE